MTHEEKPMCRKVKQALHYYVPDADLSPEDYSHYFCYWFSQLVSENDLTLSGSYCEKLYIKAIY